MAIKDPKLTMEDCKKMCERLKEVEHKVKNEEKLTEVDRRVLRAACSYAYIYYGKRAVKAGNELGMTVSEIASEMNIPRNGVRVWKDFDFDTENGTKILVGSTQKLLEGAVE